MTKRLGEVDIAKGIGIILIVCGHLGIVKWFAYLFHVPLFFFLSGYVTNIDYTPKSYVLRKIRIYYFPFLFAEVLFLLLHNLFQPIYGYTYYTLSDIIIGFFKILLFQNIGERLGQLWFLFALFVVSTFFYVLWCCFGEKGTECISIILVLLHGFLLTNTWIIPIDSCAILEIICIMLPVFTFGYVCRQKFLSKKMFTWFRGSIALGILLFCHYVLNSHFDVRTNSFSNTWSALLSSLSGIYLCFAIGFLLDNSKIGKILKLCGRNSIYILILHPAIYKMVEYLFVFTNIEISKRFLQAIQLVLSICVPLLIGLVISQILSCIRGGIAS